MHILILGASGRVGSLTLAEALSRSHTITALVRNPDSLTPHPNLTIITGSPLSLPDIESAFLASPNGSPDAVLVTLNSQRTSDNPFAKSIAPPRLMALATENTVAVSKKLRRENIRIVSLSAYGVGKSNGSVFWPVRMLMNYSNMKIAYRDHEEVEGFMKGEGGKVGGVRWTGVKPTMLTEGEKREVKVFGERGEGLGILQGISKASVAAWLVECVEGEEWVGMTPVIAN